MSRLKLLAARPPSCLSCRHFEHTPAGIEASLPGLSSLGSAYAAVRCDDGTCAVHERYVAGSSLCRDFYGWDSGAQPALA